MTGKPIVWRKRGGKKEKKEKKEGRGKKAEVHRV